MKYGKYISARVLCGLAAVLILSACTPPVLTEENAREILREEKVPELAVRDLEGNNSEVYRTSRGDLVLFNAGAPSGDKDSPVQAADFLRFSRLCELYILSYRLESVKMGEVKKNRAGEWVCAVSAGFSRRILTLDQTRGYILEKGFPINWKQLDERQRKDFLSVDSIRFHDEKYDLCYLYEALRDQKAPDRKIPAVRCELVYDAAQKKWSLRSDESRPAAVKFPFLEPLLSEFSQNKLESSYELTGMTFRKERDNGGAGILKIFCDKTAAEYHMRMEEKGQVFDEAAGRWEDYEGKRQNDQLREQYARYRNKDISLPDFLRVLHECPKASVRDPILTDLRADILAALDLLSIPSQKNRKEVDRFARVLELFPGQFPEAAEKISAFRYAATAYDEQKTKINWYLRAFSGDMTGLLSIARQVAEKKNESAQLEKRKTDMIRRLRKTNGEEMDKVIRYLSSWDDGRSLPPPEKFTGDFFIRNEIDYKPFGEKEYSALSSKYIRGETAKAFPVPLNAMLDALRKELQEKYAVPKVGDTISVVSVLNGPYKGQTLKGKYYGVSDSGSIRLGSNRIALHDLDTEERMRFDEASAAKLREKYYARGRDAFLEERRQFADKLRNSRKMKELRRKWAWNAGWIAEPGGKYFSVKELLTLWLEWTNRQKALDEKIREAILANKSEMNQFKLIQDGDPCAKYAGAFLCLEKLADLAGDGVVRSSVAALKDAAGEQIVMAQSYLGRAYLEGRFGLEKSPENAFFWLKKAADQGEPQAVRLVADMLRSGIGTNADPEGAEKYSASISAGAEAGGE